MRWWMPWAVVCFVLLLAAACWPVTASAQPCPPEATLEECNLDQHVETPEEWRPTLAPYYVRIREVRATDRRVRARKCLAPRTYRWRVAEIPRHVRPLVLRQNRVQLRRSLSAGRHRCIPAGLRYSAYLAVPGSARYAFTQLLYPCERGAAGWRTNTGNGYYGGLQMDVSFQRTYGPDALRRWGTADRWPWYVQVVVANRARAAGRGYYPWPTCARQEGLI